MAAFAAPGMPLSPSRWWIRPVGLLVSLATAIVILAVAMLPFFTSAWIGFEQGRAGSAGLAGYTEAQVREATDGIVHDLLFGGSFDVATAAPGCAPPAFCPLHAVLDPAERSHMRDVRAVFGGFAIVALVSALGLLVVGWRTRSGSARAAVWLAVRRGASWLAVLLVVLGVIAVTAFDAAFELFHRILFPGGNFDFDPRTEKLVQLFPEQFWSETAIAWGALAVVACLAVALGARLRAAGASRAGGGFVR